MRRELLESMADGKGGMFRFPGLAPTLRHRVGRTRGTWTTTACANFLNFISVDPPIQCPDASRCTLVTLALCPKGRANAGLAFAGGSSTLLLLLAAAPTVQQSVERVACTTEHL